MWMNEFQAAPVLQNWRSCQRFDLHSNHYRIACPNVRQQLSKNGTQLPGAMLGTLGTFLQTESCQVLAISAPNWRANQSISCAPSWLALADLQCTSYVSTVSAVFLEDRSFYQPCKARFASAQLPGSELAVLASVGSPLRKASHSLDSIMSVFASPQRCEPRLTSAAQRSRPLRTS